jgi:hypothetical protein
VIDLRGAEGTRAGVGLVEYGFRPIPLYNALQAENPAVDMRPVIEALASGAEAVERAPNDAPPAFLLDARRMGEGVRLARYDFGNRSICRISDFPSPNALLREGIRRAVLIQVALGRPAPDLEPVLFEWQRCGIALWLKVTRDVAEVAPMVLKRKWWPIRAAHALRVFSFHQRSDGSFGALVPQGG